jgi:hypothetical protein
MPTKILWSYWHQGWDRAPELVKLCSRSWVAENPEYENHFLDERSLSEYISLPKEITPKRRDLSLQKFSNIVRLALLSAHGGVWMDATVYCTRPLRDWLEEYYAAGFFVFRYPAPDKMLTNWFFAAEPDSIILRRYAEKQLAFFAGNTFSNQGTRWEKPIVKAFSPYWNKDYRSTGRWLSWFARKILRVYPYYISYYLFNHLILNDPECAARWNAAKPFPAKPTQQLRILSKLENGIELARAAIASGAAPMYKLNWRSNLSAPYWSEVVRALTGDTR